MKAGWQDVQLGQLFEITSSKRVMQSDWRESGVPFYRAREIVRLAADGKVENELFISEDQFEAFKNKFGAPEAGDIMVTGVGTLGRCYVVRPGDRFYFKDASVLWFRSRNAVDPRFIEYSFQTPIVIEQISAGVGATVGTFTISRAEQTRIPLPPLEEQKRIVSVLDEAFEGLSRARDNAEANLMDLKALEASALASCFSAKEMTSCVPITEVCDFQGGTQPPKSEFVSEDRPGYVRLLQIRDFKSDDKAVFVPDRRGLRKCNEEDVMIGRYGASVGQILRGKTGAYNVALVRTIPDERRVSKDFLFHFLKSNMFQQPLLEKSSRGAQDGFNKGDLAQIKVPLLPLGRQEEICAQLGALSENVETLGRLINQSKRELETLRQSLLQKAFSGELT